VRRDEASRESRRKGVSQPGGQRWETYRLLTIDRGELSSNEKAQKGNSRGPMESVSTVTTTRIGEILPSEKQGRMWSRLGVGYPKNMGDTVKKKIFTCALTKKLKYHRIQ